MGKIALIFSGQGAQYSGMGKALYDASPAAKAVFDLADSIREGTSAQCFEGAAGELNRTVNTQPCVFTADLAAAYAVKEAGIVPDCVAGFSLGEIAALAYAGNLTDEDWQNMANATQSLNRLNILIVHSFEGRLAAAAG